MKISLSPFMAIVTSLLFIQCEKEGIFNGDGSQHAPTMIRTIRNTLPATCYTSEFRGTYTLHHDTTITQTPIARRIYVQPQDSLVYFYMSSINSPDSFKVYFDSTGVANHTESYSAPQGSSSISESIRLEYRYYGMFATWSYRTTSPSDPSISRTCYYEGPLYY